MEWIKISEMYPEDDMCILYYDGKSIIAAHVIDKSIRSFYYYCNDENCRWISDDCGCDITVSFDHFWMPFPDRPKRLSEKTSDKEDAIV